jgi:hypothetical protein
MKSLVPKFSPHAFPAHLGKGNGWPLSSCSPILTMEEGLHFIVYAPQGPQPGHRVGHSSTPNVSQGHLKLPGRLEFLSNLDWNL